MTHDRSRDRHLDSRAILDYLDERLDAGARRAADEHLGRPCSVCLERVRAMGEILETMRRDRAGEVPAWLHARALAAFDARERPSFADRVVEAVAELVFDSLRTPPPALARRAIGDARRLRYTLGRYALDLEVEPAGPATQSLSGRLECDEPVLWTLSVRAGSEDVDLRPDPGGHFSAPHLPAGPLAIRAEGPGERFRLPEIGA